MQIPKSEKNISWPPPLPNPGDAPAIDRERSTVLVTVNTFRACVYFAATVGKLSYLVIVLMGHTMFVNIEFYFLSLDLISRWLTRDID